MPSGDPAVSRRSFLRTLAGGAILAAGGRFATADEAAIGRLIAAAQAFSVLSQRIDFISRAWLGTRYQADTLIGGPRKQEVLVVRDDRFDCVTYCETVLAAAKASGLGEFKSALQTIRYHNGIVTWRERNHYFFEWSQHNIENKICRAVSMNGAVDIEKTVYWHKQLGKRRFSISVIPRAMFLANVHLLATGDIVGFISGKSYLDYFHTGFVAFGDNGVLLLRHAAKSRHRVLDERMDRFVAVNRVRYVTLLRPQDGEAG